MASKEELNEILDDYYTKSESEAALDVKANEINLSVSETINNIKIGARNLIRNSKNLIFIDYYFETDELVATHDDEGNVTLISTTMNVTNDGNGNVTMEHNGITVTDDNSGNISINS